MNLIITALLFNFLISCWPKTNIVDSKFDLNLFRYFVHVRGQVSSSYKGQFCTLL